MATESLDKDSVLCDAQPHCTCRMLAVRALVRGRQANLRYCNKIH
jgi:hypothetical protein